MLTFDEYFAIETRKNNTMQQYDKKKKYQLNVTTQGRRIRTN